MENVGTDAVEPARFIRRPRTKMENVAADAVEPTLSIRRA